LKRSNRLVLLVGVFLAVVAFVGILLLQGGTGGGGGGGGPEASAPTVLTTVVAINAIPLGTTITADMVTTQDMKVGIERKDTAFQSVLPLVGEITRRPIAAGAQLEAADFDTSSTACGTIAVPAGLRAMAVQVDQVSGVGTVINAGDFVDAVVGFTGDKFPVVTLNPTDNSITVVAGLNGTSVKLLIEGMQVLCRQLPPPPAPANGQAPAPTASNGTSLNGQQEIVILGVTAPQAEIIKFAQLDGSISLALRSAADFTQRDANGNPIPPPPAGTNGVTLKILTTDFAVPIPELVEAVLPAQASRKP
jgi:Flp pilus assembly protein CpaB